MINYAHRGASEYAPENTLSSFYLGLLQGANGIETDVQMTGDGELVLFHDDTVDRVSDGHGRVCEYTLEQLRELKIYGKCTTGFYDRVITLREFLEKFSSYDISFAIELKGAGVEQGTLALAEEFGILEKATFTSFKYDYIKEIKRLNGNARVGWLAKTVTDEEISALKDIGGEEMAPKAEIITDEIIARLRSEGLGVRAWGINSIEIMRHMCDAGVDGMTVNFPDRLAEYINFKK